MPIDFRPDKPGGSSFDFIPDEPSGQSPEPTPRPKNLMDVWQGAQKNLGRSAKGVGEAIVYPFTHPKDTARGAKDLALGTVSKLTRMATGGEVPPALADAEDTVEAVAYALKDRYGGWDNIMTTASEDPLGFLLDVSTALSTGGGLTRAAGWGMKTAGAAKTGEAVGAVGRGIQAAGEWSEPLTLARGATKFVTTGARKPIAKKMYRSVIKPGTSLKADALERIIETGLESGTTPFATSLGAANDAIIDLERRIDDLITSSTRAGGVIDADLLTTKVQAWAYNNAPQKYKAKEWIKDVSKELNDFMDGRPLAPQSASQGKPLLYVDDAHAIKRDIYDLYSSKYAGRESIAGTHTPYQAAVGMKIAQQIKEGIEEIIPEIKGLNAQQGALIEMRREVARAANRIANRDIFGMGDFLGTGIGGHLAGAKGAIMGLAVRQVLTRPEIAAPLAVALYRNNPGVGAGYFMKRLRMAGLLGEEQGALDLSGSMGARGRSTNTNQFVDFQEDEGEE